MTLPQLTKYCRDNQDVIFIRAPKNGKWGSYSLAQLDPAQVEKLIYDWHQKDIIPARMLES